MLRLSALAILMTQVSAQDQRTNVAVPSDFLQLDPSVLNQFESNKQLKVTDVVVCSDNTSNKLQQIVLSYSDGSNNLGSQNIGTSSTQMNCKSTGALAQGDCFSKITTYTAKDGFDRIDLETVQGKQFIATFNGDWANGKQAVQTLNGGNSDSKACITGLYGFEQTYTDKPSRPIALGAIWKNYTDFLEFAPCKKTYTDFKTFQNQSSSTWKVLNGLNVVSQKTFFYIKQDALFAYPQEIGVLTNGILHHDGTSMLEFRNYDQPNWQSNCFWQDPNILKGTCTNQTKRVSWPKQTGNCEVEDRYAVTTSSSVDESVYKLDFGYWIPRDSLTNVNGVMMAACNGYNWPSCTSRKPCESPASAGNCTWEAPKCNGNNAPLCRSSQACSATPKDRNCTYYGNITVATMNLLVGPEVLRSSIPKDENIKINVTNLNGRMVLPCDDPKADQRACSQPAECSGIGSQKINCTTRTLAHNYCEQGQQIPGCVSLNPCSSSSGPNCTFDLNYLTSQLRYTQSSASKRVIAWRNDIVANISSSSFKDHTPLADWIKLNQDQSGRRPVQTGLPSRGGGQIFSGNTGSTEGGTPVGRSEKSSRVFGQNVVFDVSQGLTVSAIQYCRRIIDRGAFSKLNVTFGFGKTAKSIVVGGDSNANTQYVCKEVSVQLDNCFTSIGVDGKDSLQRLQLTTKQGRSILAGFDYSDMQSWGSFSGNGACLTGLHGAAFNGEIISIGFYYNDEVLPDGRQYSVSNRLAPSRPTITDRPVQNRPNLPTNQENGAPSTGSDQATTILIAVTLVVILILGFYICIKLSSTSRNKVGDAIIDDNASTDQELGNSKNRIIIPNGTVMMATDVSATGLIDKDDLTKTREHTPTVEMKTPKLPKGKFDVKKGRRNDKLALRDLLRQINLHTKYYGNFIKNGVDTIDEFVALDKAHLSELHIEDEDLEKIMKQIEATKSRRENGSEAPEPHTLFELLQEVGIGEEYGRVFEAHGVKTIEDLAKVTEADFVAIGIQARDYEIMKGRLDRAQEIVASRD